MIGPSIPCHLLKKVFSLSAFSPRHRVHQWPHFLGASTVPVGGPGLWVETLGLVLDLEDGLRWRHVNLSMDWFKGNFTGKKNIFNGKNHGFL